jgi:hypothetical protein
LLKQIFKEYISKGEKGVIYKRGKIKGGIEII